MVLQVTDNFVKFNGTIYLLNDFFVTQILKGSTDLRGKHRSLDEATKHGMGKETDKWY
jgi:hypothetical protein